LHTSFSITLDACICDPTTYKKQLSAMLKDLIDVSSS
jgi:hypothetical protein